MALKNKKKNRFHSELAGSRHPKCANRLFWVNIVCVYVCVTALTAICLGKIKQILEKCVFCTGLFIFLI